MSKLFNEKDIIRIEDGKRINTKDYIVKEEFYKLKINGEDFLEIAASPVKVKEMALGRIYCEGLIKSLDQIQEIKFRQKEKIIEIITRSNSSKEDTDEFSDDFFLDKKIESSIIFKVINMLSNESVIFKKTGGVHNALLTDHKGKEIIFREDIARHNTVDKIIGYILNNKIKVKDKILVLSCRISTKIIKKAVDIGFKVLISQSPPSLKAIKIAERKNITLIGFVRNRRMNIYSQPERILLKQKEYY